MYVWSARPPPPDRSGPLLERLQAVASTEGAGCPLLVRVGAAVLDGLFAATGGARSADYPQDSKFMPEARLQLAWRNKAGVNGVKTARVSAILMVTLLT